MLAQPLFMKPLRDPAQVRKYQRYHQQDDASAQAESEPALGRVFRALLAAAGPAQHRTVMLTPPGAASFPYSARSADRRMAQRELMSSVVADYPLPPEGRHRVQVEHGAVPALRRAAGASGRGIEGLPAVGGKVSLYPGMRIFCADHIVPGKVVELVAAESVHHARRNPQSAQHHGHRRREIFAVTLLTLEQKIGQWVAHRRARLLQGVGVA